MIAGAWLMIVLAGSPAAQDRDTVLKNASAAMAAGRRDEAKRLLKDAGERFGSVRALLQLAKLQSVDGDFPGALETVRSARRLAPNAEEVLAAYAQVSLAARTPVPAILTLETLTRLCPTVAQYHYLLGVALMTAGDMTAATDALARAQGLDPDRPLTLFALGLVHNNQKRFADAKTMLSRSVELDPEGIDALAALAEAEAGLGEIPAAERDATRVIAKVPGHATANLVIGLVRMEQQRYADARDALLAAAKTDPRSPKPEYQLSLVYARLDDPANAERHLDLYRTKLREMDAGLKALRETGFGAGIRP